MIRVNTATQLLQWNDISVRAAIGKSGASRDKIEGDGKTPIGQFALGPCYYRADKIQPPPNLIMPATAIEKNFGWCDDPTHADYNKFVLLPHPARHENLWRDDGKYDVVVVIQYNTESPTPNKGSAIFLHLAKPDYTGTEGCVAIGLADMMRLWPAIAPNSMIHIF